MHGHAHKYIQAYVQTCTRVCVSLCLFVIEAKVAATADTAFFWFSCHFTWQTDKKMRRTFQCTKGVSDSSRCCCCSCNWELSAMLWHTIRLAVPGLVLLTFLFQLCLLATINIHSVFAVFNFGFSLMITTIRVTRYRFDSLDLCLTRALHLTVYCLAFCYLVGIV